MIEIRGLTKVYGPTTAVADLTVTVHPGVVRSPTCGRSRPPTASAADGSTRSSTWSA